MTIGRVVIQHVASKRLAVFVLLISAVTTRGHTTGIFDPVAESLPAVDIRAPSPPDVDQLLRRSRYLLSTLRGVKVVLGFGSDELERLTASFPFPRVELHLAKAMFHVQTEILGKSSCGVNHRMVSCFRFGGPFRCCVSIGHVERVPS